MKGRNIPCDLHMEHLNRNLKTAMGNAGANLTTNVIRKCGRTLQPLTELTSKFYDHQPSQVHAKAKDFLDIKVVVDCLLANKVFQEEGRIIPDLEANKNFLRPLDKKKFTAWLGRTLDVDVQ